MWQVTTILTAGLVSLTALALSAPTCQTVDIAFCEKFVNVTTLPNILGHESIDQIAQQLAVYDFLSDGRCDLLRALLCAYYFPVCPLEGSVFPFPCRPLCAAASRECDDELRARDIALPRVLLCENFPDEHCVALDGGGNLRLVQHSLPAEHTHLMATPRVPAPLAPLEGEEDLNVEVVSMETKQLPGRRYDIVDLGDDTYFRGWADVQGTGAANDYCRVVGRGKRKFLSCALAGSMGQEHHYVSQLGFETGYPNTWFMRDVDSDGRDDYCRCTGSRERSRILCMKAGENGFYGSAFQGGSQFTFALPGSEGCSDKRLNPFFGA